MFLMKFITFRRARRASQRVTGLSLWCFHAHEAAGPGALLRHVDMRLRPVYFLLEQVLLPEQHAGPELVVGVLLLCEPVTLVLREQVPGLAAVAADRRYDLVCLDAGTRGSLAPVTIINGRLSRFTCVKGEISTSFARCLASRSSPYSTRRKSRR
jgi:hypothetical protein